MLIGPQASPLQANRTVDLDPFSRFFRAQVRGRKTDIHTTVTTSRYGVIGRIRCSLKRKETEVLIDVNFRFWQVGYVLPSSECKIQCWCGLTISREYTNARSSAIEI